MSTSKIINKSNSSEYESWTAPQVNDNVSPTNRRYMTAEEIESIQQQAYDEGYKEGFSQGLVDGQAEINQRCNYLESIMNFLVKPLEKIDEQVNQQLFQLSMSVAGHIIRREIRTDPGQVIAVVRAAMNALPVAERDVKVYLHPEDVLLVREALSISEDEITDTRPWRIIEDPVLTRGGCRVRSENSTIDATIEARLNRVIATLLGGERGEDFGDNHEDSNPDESDN